MGEDALTAGRRLYLEGAVTYLGPNADGQRPAVLRVGAVLPRLGDHPTSSLPKAVGSTGGLPIPQLSSELSFLPGGSTRVLTPGAQLTSGRFGQGRRFGFGLGKCWAAGKFGEKLPC